VALCLKDDRFFYEPLLAAHPKNGDQLATTFGSFQLGAPLWISSMTGGMAKGRALNKVLAKAAGEFKLGMGLGSIRPYLEDKKRFKDFYVRPLMKGLPLFANIGVYQVEELLGQKKIDHLIEAVKKLECDGLIVHVNPLQEWLQPDGDRFNYSPIKVIEALCEVAPFPLIVKSVGDGMGPASLLALSKLPLLAIELSGFGGTNFTMVEEIRRKVESPLSFVGHSTAEMVEFLEKIPNLKNLKIPHLILSGGVQSYLDGYYLIKKSPLPSLYGMANTLLQKAVLGEGELIEFIEKELNDLAFCASYLTLSK